MRRGARLVAVAALVIGPLVVACSSEPPPPPPPIDDGAHPVGPGGPTLTSGFDRSVTHLAAALPHAAMGAAYTEVQSLQPETLVPSEAAGCQPDAVTTPALPATELLGTKPPGQGRHQPTFGDVVAARAPSELVAADFFAAATKAAEGCASFSSAARDLGEGSLRPGEQGSSTVAQARQGDWAGVRVTTPVTLTGKGWTEEVARQSLLLGKGQVVVLVRVEGETSSAVSGQVDSLMTEVLAALEPSR